jgi:hypothetical protein
MQRLLFVFVLCALVNTAQADMSDYSYLRVGYTEETLQVGPPLDDVVFSGVAIDLSIASSDHWALIAGRYSADAEEPMLRYFPSSGLYLPLRKIPQEFSSFGILYHSALSKDTDFLISYEKGKRKFWFVDSYGPLFRNGEEDGKRVSAGLRSKFSDRLEGKVLYQQFEFNDSVENRENEIIDRVVEGNYFFTKKYSLGLSFMRNDFSDRLTVNVGCSF